MAELATLQVAASIIQVIDVGVRVIARLKAYHDKTNGLPVAFKHISKKLPIFIHALEQTKSALDVMTDSARKAFLPAIEECFEQIKRLETTIDAALPKVGDTGRMRSWKAIVSIKYESEVKEMDRVIQEYMGVMTQHHVSSLATRNLTSKHIMNSRLHVCSWETDMLQVRGHHLYQSQHVPIPETPISSIERP